jgi:hypothetical protein
VLLRERMIAHELCFGVNELCHPQSVRPWRASVRSAR